MKITLIILMTFSIKLIYGQSNKLIMHVSTKLHNIDTAEIMPYNAFYYIDKIKMNEINDTLFLTVYRSSLNVYPQVYP